MKSQSTLYSDKESQDFDLQTTTIKMLCRAMASCGSAMAWMDGDAGKSNEDLGYRVSIGSGVS